MLAAGALLTPLLSSALPSSAASSTPSPTVNYPLGVVSGRAPSGMAPPAGTSLPGYKLVYNQDFAGRTLPSEWGKFDGEPLGDPGAMFVSSHVKVGGGIVRLVAQRDRANGGNWATGGMCLCAKPQLYGAFFVRSRVTGPGPDVSEMLWPAAKVWPPEVDFNEMGYPTNSTSWTVHYGKGRAFVQRTRNFDMMKWHTWGVVWTPKRLTFTIDGRAWGALNTYAQIPHQKMWLDVQQQTWCHSSVWDACPRKPSELQIDWVQQYRHS